MVDTAGYGSGISGSGSQTYIFESILKIYWVKTNNFFDNFLVPDPGPFLVPDPRLFLFCTSHFSQCCGFGMFIPCQTKF